jgi:hypothetical protein
MQEISKPLGERESLSPRGMFVSPAWPREMLLGILVLGFVQFLFVSNLHY